MDMMSSKADPYLVLTVDQALHTKERECARVYTVRYDHWALLKLCIYEVYTNTVSLSLIHRHTHIQKYQQSYGQKTSRKTKSLQETE
jgi:hypothetical protein